MRKPSLPEWDGVSRVMTWTEKKRARKVERDRISALTPEERRAEIEAVDDARTRKRYWSDPSSVTRHMLVRRPGLKPELDDYDRRNCIPTLAERRRIKGAQRYAAQVLRSVTWNFELDDFVWGELVDLRASREAATGIKWSIDHMYPMQGETVSGLHTAANWQLIPLWMNLQKQRRPFLTQADEWIECINRPLLLSCFDWTPEGKQSIVNGYKAGIYG